MLSTAPDDRQLGAGPAPAVRGVRRRQPGPVGALGGVLANLAEHDALTGLPNRTQFVRLARHAVDHGNGVLAMVDLDRFKQVNDTLGHAIGDRLLVELAQRLARHVRDGDTVARLGGDEFGIVLPDVTTEAETLHALGRIRSLLAEPLVIDDLPLAVEAGVGFVLIGWDGAGLDTLLTKVDVAMCAAKRGHLGVTRHRAEHEQYDATRLRLVGEPAGAIADEQLVLHHQPKTDLRTGQVTAVEALVRWQHPERGLLYPGDFLLAAEQTELADPLTRWVLRRATAALPRLDPTGKLSMAVNVSVRSLERSDFADEVPRVPAGTRPAPNRILLEITETALLADPTKAASTRSACRAISPNFPCTSSRSTRPSSWRWTASRATLPSSARSSTLVTTSDFRSRPRAWRPPRCWPSSQWRPATRNRAITSAAPSARPPPASGCAS